MATWNFDFGIPVPEEGSSSTGSFDAVVIDIPLFDVNTLLTDSGNNYIADSSAVNLPVASTGYMQTVVRTDGGGAVQFFTPDGSGDVYKRTASSTIMPTQGMDYYSASVTSNGVTLSDTLIAYAMGTATLTLTTMTNQYFTGTNEAMGNVVRGPIEFRSASSTGQNFGADSMLLVEPFNGTGTGSIQIQFNASGNYTVVSNNLQGTVSSLLFLNGSINYSSEDNHAIAYLQLTWNDYTGSETVGEWVLI